MKEGCSHICRLGLGYLIRFVNLIIQWQSLVCLKSSFLLQLRVYNPKPMSFPVKYKVTSNIFSLNSKQNKNSMMVRYVVKRPVDEW